MIASVRPLSPLEITTQALEQVKAKMTRYDRCQFVCFGVGLGTGIMAIVAAKVHFLGLTIFLLSVTMLAFFVLAPRVNRWLDSKTSECMSREVNLKDLQEKQKCVEELRPAVERASTMQMLSNVFGILPQPSGGVDLKSTGMSVLGEATRLDSLRINGRKPDIPVYDIEALRREVLAIKVSSSVALAFVKPSFDKLNSELNKESPDLYQVAVKSRLFMITYTQYVIGVEEGRRELFPSPLPVSG